MLKKKSSIQINIEGKGEKNFVVPTFIIRNWQKLALGTFVVLISLVGSIIYISTKQKADEISSQYANTLNKVKQKNDLLKLSKSESEKEVSEAIKSFNKIDSTLEIINKKMKDRGLKTIILENAGGPIEENEDNIELISTYYEEALKKLDRELESLPIGLPHDGRVTSSFGYRRNPFTNAGRELHSGVDLKGTTGDLIKSTAKGTVTYAGYEGNYGYVVKIKHANNFETRYAHLTRTLVRKGEKVSAGTTVGLLGSTGRSTGPHLHYEILKNDKKINPEKFFKL